jgi:hypothetical protein
MAASGVVEMLGAIDYAWHHQSITALHTLASKDDMNGDTVAIALDRLKFYARDAVVTLTQVRTSQLPRIPINSQITR